MNRSRPEPNRVGRPTLHRTGVRQIVTVITAFVFLAWAGSLSAGVGIGGDEIQVNTSTAGEQGYPQVSRRSSGFVVVWESYGQDGSGKGVMARRLDVRGDPVGPEFPINSYTTGAQDTVSVASDADGNFVVVWESFGQDGSTDGVFGRRFMADGVAVGTEFRVNTTTVNSQDDPRVAGNAIGAFTVVWEAFNQDGSAASVALQRYSSSGVKLGGEVVVNSYTTGAQLDPDIAMGVLGNFIVVWASVNQDGSKSGIFGQRFGASGSAQGTEFRVNSFTTGTQDEPRVASDLFGNFIVAWESNGQDGSANGVFAQRYNAMGAVLGTEFRVNDVTVNSQDDAALATDAFGGFTIAWESIGQDGSLTNGVFARSFDAGGIALSDDTQVNLTVPGSQDDAAIAVSVAGNVAVAWNGFGQDGDQGGIIERYFAVAQVTTTTLPTTTSTTTTTLPVAAACGPSPHAGCILSAPSRSKVQVRLNGSGTLVWKFARGESTQSSEFLNPAGSSGVSYHLCMYDAGTVSQPVLVANLPTGELCRTQACWSALGGDGYKYRDKDATPDGVVTAKLKAGAEGKSKIVVKGKGMNLDLPSLPLAFPVTVDLVVQSGQEFHCWQNQFTAPQTNSASHLKARGP